MSEANTAVRSLAQGEAETYGLKLIVGPEDEAFFLAAGCFPGKRGRIEDCAFYAVIHRRFGLWTHLYRVVPADSLHGFIVYLEKTFNGDAVEHARDWLRRIQPA